MKRIFTLIIVLLSYLPFNIWGQQYFFQQLSPESDFTFGPINTFAEDNNGFLWIGCNNGLFYHNTVGIKKISLYHNDENYSQSVRVNKIFKNQDNKLLICTEAGLFIESSQENQFDKIPLFKKDVGTDVRSITDIIQISDDTYIILEKTVPYLYTVGDSILAPVKLLEERGIRKISYINKNKDGNIYIGTTTGTIYTSKDIHKELETLYEGFGTISSVCKDGNKYYVGYSNRGIDVLNLQGNRIYQLNSNLSGKHHLVSNNIREIIRLDNGDIWIGTHLGLIILSNNKKTVINNSSDSWLPHRSVYTIYEGKDKGLWVGTYSGGIAYYKDCNYRFKHVEIEYDKSLAVKSIVSSFAEDANNNIWTGSEDDGGLNLYNPKTNSFLSSIDVSFSEKTKGIKSLGTIDNNYIAVGKFNRGIYIYDYKKNKEALEFNIPIANDGSVLSIKQLDNILYIAGRRDLYTYNLDTKETNVIFTLRNVYFRGRIWQLYIDSSQNIWICTDEGLYLKSKGSETIDACFDKGLNFSLYDKTIYSICEDNDGRMWVGTNGMGVFIYTPYDNSLVRAPQHENLHTADIYNLIKDNENNIWYNSNQGLYRYDFESNRTSYYSEIDGLVNQHVTPNSAFCSQSGQIYFGGLNGFNIINPAHIKVNNTDPQVYLSEMLINNKPLSPKSIKSSNSLNLKKLNELTLNHNQNSFAIKVVANNFIKYEKNKFRYRLQSFNEEWVDINQNETIRFTKVPSGKYTLEVIGANNDNTWSTKPYSLEIRILPPYWRRWYSLTSYFIILVVVIFFIYRELRTKMLLRKEITAERYKSQANDLIHSERVKFFTNISHELRTPLSLISSPINTLMSMYGLDENKLNLLKTVDRNTQRLLRLVNQTLDFRLLEVGKLKPTLKKADIIQLTTDAYGCFEQQIKDQEINFTFTSDFKSLMTNIDSDMIEKIIFNLLSNAIKYTPRNGYVFLSIEKKKLSKENYSNYICSGNEFYDDAIEISVRDTGKGINAKLLPYIFDRFAKGEKENQFSSGIGLHLCNEYSRLNGGNILLTSTEGVGSTFILNIPVQKDSTFENSKNKNLIVHTPEEKVKSEIEDYRIAADNSTKKTILLVDDDNELRTYLKTLLNPIYTVLTARSGEIALEMLNEIEPNMVITDISMKEVSGLDLLDNIKKHPLRRHIPVIVLTAFSETTYQMESILRGADSFFTKPLNDKVLIAQINNIFHRNNSGQTAITSKQQTSKVDEKPLGSFIDKVENIIESNFQNSSFCIDNILEELNISKSTLDRKLRQQANLTPSSLIRDVRLKNAIKLMKSNKFNIDEIATYVGFNSSSYFIRTFKSKYGVTPREYRQKHKE